MCQMSRIAVSMVDPLSDKRDYRVNNAPCWQRLAVSGRESPIHFPRPLRSVDVDRAAEDGDRPLRWGLF
jgi:hypothetical protein